MSEHHWKLTDEEYEFIKGEVIHIFITYKAKWGLAHMAVITISILIGS